MLFARPMHVRSATMALQLPSAAIGLNFPFGIFFRLRLG